MLFKKKYDTYLHMYAKIKLFFFEFYKCIKRTFTTRNIEYRQKQRNLNYYVGILNHPFCVMKKKSN